MAKSSGNKVILIVLSAIAGVLALCVVIGIVGAVLGSGDKDQKVAAEKPPMASATSSTTPLPAVSSSTPVANIPPKPDTATRAAYLADLKAIDTKIIGDKDEEIIVDRGRSQCTSIKEWPNDRAKLVDLTNKRFTAPGYPNGFGTVKAGKILDVVHKRLCPTW